MSDQQITHDIYVSYSPQDAGSAARIKDALAAAGLRVWLADSPKSELVGQQGIASCAWVVVIVSPNAQAAPVINQEIAYARSLDKKIIPVLVRGSAAESIPPALSRTQHLDLRQPETFNQAMQMLIDQIGGKRRRAASTAVEHRPPPTPVKPPEPPRRESLLDRLAARITDRTEKSPAEPEPASLPLDVDAELEESLFPPPGPAPSQPVGDASSFDERKRMVGDSAGASTPDQPQPLVKLKKEADEPMPPPAPEPKPAEPAPEQTPGVLFSAYYAKETRPAEWQPLMAYIFQDFASAAVSRDVQEELGDRPDIRGTTRPAQQSVEQGALVTATPHIPGFEFDPPSQAGRFRQDWRRFDFEFQAVDAPLDEAANGRVTFTVEGVIVADVPLSVYVTEELSTAEKAPTEQTTANAYEAIFCSYSHDDTAIVERVEAAYKALGIDYLRDVTTLRAGHSWNDELINLIERADIFQLFWSDHAKDSKFVAQEWQHALALIAARQKDEHFIRPVRWQEPMPDPPSELAHIHFAYQPELAG